MLYRAKALGRNRVCASAESLCVGESHKRAACRPTVQGNHSAHGRDMTDPRNVAHDKKVQQEKKHRGEEIAPDAIHAPQPGQKPALKHDDVKDDDAEKDGSGSS